MARLHTSFILGYHGCCATLGERVLSGEPLKSSQNDYDWLGPGIYFWDSDPQRAWEWADAKKGRDANCEPFVIGAVIDLGNCLDLVARDSLDLLAQSFVRFKETSEKAGRALPANKPASRNDGDKLLRYLDCAVIQYLHAALAESSATGFDTVRGLFTEGDPLFEGSGFMKKTHAQIAVCNPDVIKGVFRVSRP